MKQSSETSPKKENIKTRDWVALLSISESGKEIEKRYFPAEVKILLPEESGVGRMETNVLPKISLFK